MYHFFFHHFEVSEGVLRNKPTFKKAKKYGDQAEGLVRDHFCVCKKNGYIYKKSEVSLDEFRLRRFFRDFSSYLQRTK